MADSSKTEKPTAKRRSDERKKGNVFLCQDAVAVATLLGSFFMFRLYAGKIAEQLSGFMRFCLGKASLAGGLVLEDEIHEIVMQALGVLMRNVLPITLVTASCAIVATFAQTRMLVSTELIRPKFSKLNPLKGLKNLFSLKKIIDTLKNILKISILMIIVYISIKDMFFESAKYLYVDIRASGQHLFSRGMSMIIKIGIAFIVIAAFDFMYQKWDYERNLRMSKEEIKEEYKQTEGDPKIKGKIKEMQRKRAMSRMMQQVPKADVVIRNPTHFAVALRYKPEQDAAPIVLAKGMDELALRIVRIAEEHKVPTIENVPLARALYADTELDQEIPPELYNPVAEVLVYIFRLNEKHELVK